MVLTVVRDRSSSNIHLEKEILTIWFWTEGFWVQNKLRKYWLLCFPCRHEFPEYSEETCSPAGAHPCCFPQINVLHFIFRKIHPNPWNEFQKCSRTFSPVLFLHSWLFCRCCGACISDTKNPSGALLTPPPFRTVPHVVVTSSPLPQHEIISLLLRN